jgi:hypothetical protein
MKCYHVTKLMPSMDGETQREMNMLKKAMLQIAFAVAVTVTFASFAATPAQAFNFGAIQSGR